MWIFTPFGAFMPSLRPPETVPPGDDQILQVRARRRVDLKRLRKHYMPDLGPTYAIPGTDYGYRANCTQISLATALFNLTFEIDYVKFKLTTERWGDDRLHAAYLGVWAVMLEAFRPRKRRRRGESATLQPFDPWEGFRP